MPWGRKDKCGCDDPGRGESVEEEPSPVPGGWRNEELKKTNKEGGFH